MASVWFYRKGDAEFGPISSQQLKELAASGQLQPSDHIRREGMEEWAAANKAKGLFTQSPSNSESSGDKSSTTGTSVAERIASDASQISDRAKATANEAVEKVTKFAQSDEVKAAAHQVKREAKTLGSNLKAAARLTAKQAQRTKLVNSTLPKAYFALGKHLYDSGERREEVGELYQRIDTAKAEIKAIEDHSKDQPKAEGMSAKAKAAAAGAKDMAQIQLLKRKASTAVTQLGQAVYESHHDEAGPAELVKPICETIEKRDLLDGEIAELSRMSEGQLVTPKRLAISGVVVLVLIVLYTGYSFLGSGDRPPPIATTASDGDQLDDESVEDEVDAEAKDETETEEEDEVELDVESPVITEVDFSNVDYSIADFESSRGPNGEEIEVRQATKKVFGWNWATFEYPTEESGYVDSSGNFIKHGKEIVWQQHPSGPLPAVKFSEHTWRNGTLHGPGFKKIPSQPNEDGGRHMNKHEFHYREGQLHGAYLIHYERGGKVQRTMFKGEKHGPSMSWYDNSKVSEGGAYWNDQKHGVWRRWQPYGRGQRDYVAHYKNGKKHGFYTKWHPEGQKEEGEYRNDKKHGQWKKWYKNGQLEYVDHFRYGESHGDYTEWYPNGQKKLSVKYRNDEREGDLTAWHPNGQKKEFVSYRNGKREGLQEGWHPNGQKEYSVTCKNGKKEGIQTEWHPNGAKRKEGRLVNDMEEGEWVGWYDDGVKEVQSLFRGGSIQGTQKWWHQNGRIARALDFNDGVLKKETNYYSHIPAIAWERIYNKDGNPIFYRSFDTEGNVEETQNWADKY